MNNTVNRASLGAKKNNLIKRLWTDSHEKQTPQRFARYAAILIMLLTLGVGQMWANETVVVGCAATNSNDYDVKLGVQAKDWGEYQDKTMTKAGLTFEGKKLYITSYDTKDGKTIGSMRFAFYNSSTDTWPSEKTVLYSWTERSSYYVNYIYNYDADGAETWYPAKTIETGARFYFDASTWDETSIKLVVGHANHQKYYSLSNITNTKLYYGNSSDRWTDAMGIGVVGNTKAAGGNVWLTDVSANASEYTGFKNYGLGSTGAGNAYLMVPNGDAGEEPSMNYYATHYNTDALNSTQTIKYAVGVNGGTPAELTEGYVPADVAISSYKFVSGTYNAVSASSGSVTLSKGGSNYSATVTAARTATTTYTVSNVHEDYSFLGWYSAANGGTLLSSEASYTLYPTSGTTAYARFSKENNHEVTISRYCTSTSSEISSTTQKIGEVTYAEISAPEIYGYTFVNWTIGNGLSKHSSDGVTSNPIRVITLSSGTYELTANYTEVLTTDWKIIGDNASGSPFGDNYNYASGKAMSKKSGYSSNYDAYKTFNITKTGTWGFKVATSGASDIYQWGYGTTSGTYITFNRDASALSKQVYNGSQHELKFNPDALGEYEFRVNYPANTYVYVTFPTAYAVTFGKGTGGNTITAEYSSVAFDSGTKVQSGKTVTFTQTARDGYTFSKWYTNSTGSGGTQLSISTSYDHTVESTNNVYAIYTENNYTVTVTAGSHGSVGTGSVSGHVDTKVTLPTATPDLGYYFTGWTTVTGSLTYTNQASATSAQVNGLTADATVQANFAPIWALVGTMNSWNASTHTLGNYSTVSTKNYGYVDVTLAANTQYGFKLKDVQGSGTLYKPTSSNTEITYANKATAQGMNNTASGNPNQTIKTAAGGSYRFTWNMTDHSIVVTYPTSWMITMGTKSFFVSGSSSASGASAENIATTGGNVTAVDNSSNTIKNKYYAANNATVTFTAAPTSGYTFEGWYNNSDLAPEHKYVDNDDDVNISGAGNTVLALSSITADKAVYAKFVENQCTVTIKANDETKGTITVAGADFDWDGTTNIGVTTTKALLATPVEGYYFSGWTLSEDPDFAVGNSGESGNSTTLSGLGGTDGSTGVLTANFLELDKIYFRNTFDDGTNPAEHWSKVYVYFAVGWHGSQGVYRDGNLTQYAEMKPVREGSYTYWAYVPRTYNNYANIAFANADMHGYFAFNGNKGVYRSDRNRALNMFVPHHTSSGTTNTTVYYSNGYWMNFGAGGSPAGYYIMRYENDGYFNPADNGTGSNQFMIVDENTIQYSLRIDNLTDGHNKFRFTSAYGTQYITSGGETGTTITTSNCNNNIVISEYNGGHPRFYITPTVEGIYTITIDQSGDAMKLRVNYPVAEGDYRLKHSYKVRKHDDSADSTVYSYSDVIKGGTSSVTVSMYINTSSTPTLSLEKCTDIDPVTWEDQSAGLSISTSTGKFDDGNGVYQFTFDSPGSTNTMSDIKPYEGNFYIKTNCAPGGWTAYKSNILEENTINPTDFDYYYAKNVSTSGTNVKFVIANDYNIAISDTIKGDSRYLTGGNNENTPSQCCVRFSYDSKTNKAARAYLKYSNNNDFLNIKPTAASKIYYKSDGAYDLYGATDAISKMGEDDGNFVYMDTVYVIPGGQASIQATYNSKSQTLVAAKTFMGGSGSSRYPVKVVYDFKTNHLTTAWMPAAEISESLSEVEVMYVRNGQETVDQITFGDGGSISSSTVYGVFKFDYSDYCGKVGSWPQQAGQPKGYTNKMCMFYFSFPFDVKVSDIFGIGTYGTEWKLQKYDGAERAKKGFFRGDGTTTFWKDLTPSDTLKAFVGYSLLLDNDYFNSNATGMVWEGKTSGSTYLYFPSLGKVSSMLDGYREITIAPHLCTLPNSWYDASSGKTLYHSNTDSHWNMLGVPLLSSENGDFSTTFKQSGLSYLYEWDYTTNTLAPAATGSSAGAIGNFTFRPMSAYMVQFTGTIRFDGSVVPASVAARQPKEKKNYTIDLEVLDGEDERINHTYVELRDGASDDFMLNEDMYMSLNSKDVNIYSFAGDYDVAANVLSLDDQLVTVGVNVKKAGTYKFSMPNYFSGTVTLVDKFNNTRTNLAFDEYEVYLEKGSINDRFDMEINIHKVPTSIENVDGNNALNDGGVHKFIENDQMYILKNGAIYNAQGVKVK